MIFTIVVSCGPQTQGARHALRFAESVLKLGHCISSIFFYQEGVQNANDFMVIPQDEERLLDRWSDLRKESGAELIVCIAAALRRGVINSQEATRYKKAAGNLHPSFELSGLGQLVDATLNSDRLVTFK
jgi:tRNA 2-thiouridine synthesizing protein D